MQVERQEGDPASQLTAIQHLMRVRQHHPEFGWGRWRLLETSAPGAVLAHSSEDESRTVLAVHNFTESPQSFKVTLEGVKNGIATDSLRDGEAPVSHGQCTLELDPFGYRWLRLRRG